MLINLYNEIQDGAQAHSSSQWNFLLRHFSNMEIDETRRNNEQWALLPYKG